MGFSAKYVYGIGLGGEWEMHIISLNDLHFHRELKCLNKCVKIKG